MIAYFPPWGIPISAEHRLSNAYVDYANLAKYPLATTRFHPTFAYEMIWNFATAGLLIWLSRRYKNDIKPGTIFAGWLMAAGVGRTWLEMFFRPDQPKIGDSFISYSLVAAALMAVAGAILLMIRYKAITPAFAENWEEEYQISEKAESQNEPDEEDTHLVKETSTVMAETTTVKKTPAAKPKKSTARKTSTAKAKTTTAKKDSTRKTTKSSTKTKKTTSTTAKKTTKTTKKSS